MWKEWQYRAPVWSPADEGAGGGGSSEGEGEGGKSGGGETGSEGGDKGASTSILDFATKAGGEEGGEAWKLPDGLDLPAHLVGADAAETLSKLGKAYQGARAELARKGKTDSKLEGVTPDSPEGYIFEPVGEDDKIAAELNSEASKPYVDAFRKAAHKLGIPDKAFSTLMREGLAGIAEGGMPIGASNEEAAKISGEQEMAALVKDVGQQEATAIVSTISAYADKLATRGVISGDEDRAEFMQMIGTARAARIFHRILTGELGEKSIPAAVGSDGAVTPQEAYAKHAAASRMPPGADRDLALAEANAAMQKAFGSEAPRSGSIRSNVL